MKRLCMGIWADRLETGQYLPIGGSMKSIFSGNLDFKVFLDFDFFYEELKRFLNPEIILRAFERDRSSVSDYLNSCGTKIDPYLFYVAYQVQQKVFDLLEVNLENVKEILNARASLPFKYRAINLSELIGFSACAEISALGQYILQHSLREGYHSSYFGGLATRSSSPLDFEEHSFVVLRDPEKTFIFDIARPTSSILRDNSKRDYLPAILATDVPFVYELFSKYRNLLVGAKNVLSCERLFFGALNPHLISEKIEVIDGSNRLTVFR